MTLTVHTSEDPGDVLAACAEFLASDPVRHNLVLTILCGRVVTGEPGRYWWVADGDRPAGVVVQSPLWFKATMTPMPHAAIEALVPVIAKAVPDLRGVSGEAGTVAAFAGAWSEATGRAAAPDEGQRLYRLDDLTIPAVDGRLRGASADALDLVVEWATAFEAETGAVAGTENPRTALQRRVDLGLAWLWDHDGSPVSMAMSSIAASGAVRIGPVFTPPEYRRRGFAAVLVAQLSQQSLAAADVDTCLLYTQLSNPTSNRIYHAIGYRAAAEILVYNFG